MNILKSLFGGKKTKATSRYVVHCSRCSNTFEMPKELIFIITSNIDDFSKEGVGAYCPHCQEMVCSRHTKWVCTDSSGSAGSWEIGCDKCGTPLRVPYPDFIEKYEAMRTTKNKHK